MTKPDDLRQSPFRRVVDDLTGGDGCACHTGIGYNTSCQHCRPVAASGAERPIDGALYSALAELYGDYLAEQGPDGYPQPMPKAWQTVRAYLNGRPNAIPATDAEEDGPYREPTALEYQS